MRASTDLLSAEASGVSECLDRLAARKRQNRPLATYRLQFNKNFTFKDARKLLPYLSALGISHCYASPLLKARPGSPHGYDIIDHNAFNPEIGTEQEFRAFSSDLKAHGLGLVLDIVPNHMGVGQGNNPWWQDVLENGRSSEHSEFFDIDWQPLRTELGGKVLLPILGGSYGEELEAGHLKLKFENGRFTIWYYDKMLPVDPHTVPLIFEAAGEFRPRHTRPGHADPDLAELESILRALAELPPHSNDEPEAVAMRTREVPQLEQRLKEVAQRSAQVANIIDRAIRACNGEPGNTRSFDALHRLLEEQAYRLAHWRVSAEEINYRRFFDINDLVGLRMENPQVFADTHRLIRKLLAEGCISGLRIDHPDGLLNPAQYFTRLQMLYAASQCSGPEARKDVAENGIEQEIQQVWGQHDWIGEGGPMFVAVEKILEHGEELPTQWPVDGTVGYEFANLVNGLFIQKRNERAFTTLYARFIGRKLDVPTLIYHSKKLIMDSAMSGEVAVLMHLLEEISSTDRRARDFTRKSLGDVIRETIACFPVYRTYVDERGTISDRDRGYINEAIVRAKRRNESTPAAIFDFLRSVLLLTPDSKGTVEGRRRRLYFTLKFQQLTGPVMAKGLEDTACYVYNRFVSVNEVGGAPDQFGFSLDEFHKGNMERLRLWPFCMLASSTHDTKRSEDVRARLNVLSEMPRDWSKLVLKWRRTNRTRKKILSDGRAVPDSNEEYLLYQTLVGVWPFHLSGRQEREAVITRVQEYMTKAVHEAKVNLSWVNPNPEYVEALRKFVSRIITGRPRARNFVFFLEELVQSIGLFGAMNSLAQTTLKLMAPGNPDIYQGTELWDFSLVDPDNRRPVDFALRRRFLCELRSSTDFLSLCQKLLANYEDGRIKLWVTMRGLEFRREHPELFRRGMYIPLEATSLNQHLCAFARVLEHEEHSEIAIVAVPRFSYTLAGGEVEPPTGKLWGDATISLPSQAPSEFENIFTGERVQANDGIILCRELFSSFPVCVLSGATAKAANTSS